MGKHERKTTQRKALEGGRPGMMNEVLPYYDFEFSKIPDHLRISFENGSTGIYDLRIVQPAPVIMENIKIIRRMKQGYVNKPLRRRNRT